LTSLDPATQVLPVLGSREALFSFAQTVIDASRVGATVVVPNPFYQIYEGAALLAGATPYYVNSLVEDHFAPRWTEVPEAVWARTQLLYVCSPDNPTGRVMLQDEWRHLFELADRHDFVIAADECYSEVYFDEAAPPLGALGAAHALGRDGYPRLISFGSLSKRSNAPGLRSGYVAGDASLVKAFLHYRTYHGSAMSPAVAAASNLPVLAALSEARIAALPDVRTMKELGFPAASFTAGGLIAPASTSAAALATLEKACADATARAEYKAIAARLNVEARYLPGDAFRTLFEADSIDNAAAIRGAGLATSK